MKKYVLILFSACLLNTEITFSKAHTPTKFAGHFLEIIDGVPAFMDALALKKCYDTWQTINSLQRIAHTYTLDGKAVSLLNLVHLEMEYTKKNIEKTDSCWTKLNEVLIQMKDGFAKFTEPLLKQAENAIVKQTNKKLIDEWIKDQKKPDSLLTKWGEADEKSALYATDSHGFFTFCSDLKNFLYDMMFNCPKARKLFKEACLEKSGWDNFDKAFHQK
jgi:hypothetical protein